MSQFVRDQAKFAERAQHAYRRGDGGWYVVNTFTKIPVRGPYGTEGTAIAVALITEPPAMRVVYVEGCPKAPITRSPYNRFYGDVR